MKFTHKFKINNDISLDNISEPIERQLERKNFKVENHKNKVHFSIIYPYMAFHWKNKNYNYFLKKGTFRIVKKEDIVLIIWNISNEYPLFFSIAIFIALMSAGIINSATEWFLLISLIILLLFNGFVRLNVKAWLNKIVKSSFMSES